MDRKAWIVISLCLALMGVNWWYASKNIEAAKKAAAEKAATQPAEPPASPQAQQPAADAPTPAPSAPQSPEQTHTLTKGSVSFEFTTRGGGVARAVLKGNDQVVLNKRGIEAVGALRREATSTDQLPYQIVEKDDRHIVFEAVSPDGLKVSKEYRFTEGEEADDHLLALTLTLTNTGANQHKSEEYYLFAGAAASLRPDEILPPSFFWNSSGDKEHKDVAYFRKAGMFSSERNEYRQSFENLRWAGVMDRFYAHIISAKEGVEQPGKLWATKFKIDHTSDEFQAMKKAGEDYGVVGAVGLPVVDLAPAASTTFEYEIYLGPKEYRRLAHIGRERSSVMFYGWFTPVSVVLTTIMSWFHDKIGSWGIAIILLTICVRSFLWYPQSRAQYSMKRMGLLAPKMKELQEKYKDDQQKQQAEMMKLYRDYGVNPVGGCLPMLLQIPIFFGFFRVLQSAAELRGQSFMWVKDLSLPDTIYTLNLPFELPFIGAHFDLNPLPLIMGVTMVLQMKLTPQPATVDKMQRRIFMLMPFMFLFFCYGFASALALYWTVQNIYSIFQTRIMKLYQKEPTLEKVVRRAAAPATPAASPFFNPGARKEKKGKPRPPRLGG